MGKTFFGFLLISVFIVSGLTDCVSAPAPKSEPDPERIVISVSDIRWTYGVEIFDVGERRFSLVKLWASSEYDKITGRLMASDTLTLYYIPDREGERIRGGYITKIEGLMSIENFNAYILTESARRLEVGNYLYLTDWSKAFSTKEEAKNWYANIQNRISSVRDVITARKKLYDDNIRAFKKIPSKIMLDTITKNKNDLIEAYNRYRPINMDISRILEKGVMIETAADKSNSIRTGGYDGLYIYRDYRNSLGLTEQGVVKEIERINSEYAKLIDTYPVN